MRRLRGIAFISAILFSLTACGGPGSGESAGPVEVVVSAAASMTDALREAEAAFETEHKDINLTFNFGSSGALQQQIAQGAPVDLFLAAAADPMSKLVQQGLVLNDAVRTVAVNTVVLVRGKTAPAVVKGWADLKGATGKVAIGNPAHVPAGQYSKIVLEKLDLWSGLEQRLVMGEDVRQVLHYVESGEVDAGFVYATDAALSDKVVVVAEAPAGTQPAIRYPLAVLKESKHAGQARLFADYLLSGKGRTILSKHGFGAGD